MIAFPVSSTYITFLILLLAVPLSAQQRLLPILVAGVLVFSPRFGFNQIAVLALYPLDPGRGICIIYKDHSSLRNTGLAAWHLYSAEIYLDLLDLDKVEDKTQPA